MTNKDISAAYVGSTGVDKLYLGNEVVWQNTPPGPAYDEQYLTIEALEDGELWMGSTHSGNTGTTVEYSTDNGQTWSQMSVVSSYTEATKVQLHTGDKCLFRGDNPRYHKGVGTPSYATHFVYSTGGTDTGIANSQGHFNVYGNVMSLINSTGFTTAKDFSQDYALFGLFYSSKVVNASNLILPATGLTRSCYTAMFQACGSLTTAPELPATTLAYSCYSSMFVSCTSLTAAPELHATILAERCCLRMFQACTSLTTAPELPATTLLSTCYQEMFSGCTSLNTITCLATDMSVSSCLTRWVKGVASTGTFYKASGVTWTSGESGIPTGWAVVDYQG